VTSTLPPAPPSAPGTPPEGLVAPWPRSHRITFFAFLALFALLVFAFREVLFPFLMAFYVAYLVEPVIDWATRGKTLGVRWGRGPTIIALYLVVFALGFLMAWYGVQRVGDSIRRASSDLSYELGKTAPAARLSIKEKTRKEVWIPKGFELEDSAKTRWKTLVAAQIGEGEIETRVLLEPAAEQGKSAPFPLVGAPLRIVDPTVLALPEGLEAKAYGDAEAEGVERLVAAHVSGPVAQWIERRTGSHFNPGHIRYFLDEQAKEQTKRLAGNALQWSQRIPFTIGGPIYQFILVLMLTAFIVVDRRGIAQFFASLPSPRLRPAYHVFMQYIDRGLAGVIRGQLVICVVNGLLTWVGLAILGVPYAPLLAFVAGVFSLIPVFGTIASSIPIVLVALAMKGFEVGLLALAWIFLIHLLEANIFNPLIMGTSAEMHPVIIIFALLAGEHAFGVWGALLAVPTASLIQSSFKFFRHEVLRVPIEEGPPKHGAWMHRLLAKRKASKPADPSPGGAS
jgi:predicted PurR-regulated permease PerM